MIMRLLDLFSGIGGFSLGLERAGMTTVGFCEIDPFCRKVLKKHWPGVPIHDDIKTLRGDEFGPVDVVCGGFPCQPFSCAGKRRGEEDDRYLWPEMLRVVSEANPRWVIGENVAGFINMGLDQCVSDLENQGYEVQAFVIPACAVGAPHRRDRCWIVACNVADINHKRLQGGIFGSESENKAKNVVTRCSSVTWDSESSGLPSINDRSGGIEHGGTSASENWPEVAARLCRVDDGLPRRMDRVNRLKALGNAVVPQIPEIIGRAIMEIENVSLST